MKGLGRDRGERERERVGEREEGREGEGWDGRREGRGEEKE